MTNSSKRATHPFNKMSNILLQNAILNEARSWINTAFHHQGRVKAQGGSKGGCDCIGLIIGVAKNLKLASRQRENGKSIMLFEFDETDYPRLPTEHKLYQALDTHFYEIELYSIKPADILLFCIDGNYQHVGIVSTYHNDQLGVIPSDILNRTKATLPIPTNGIIHSYARARKVVEHRLDEDWQKKAVHAFRFADLYFDNHT
jgi:hypothetical protein